MSLPRMSWHIGDYKKDTGHLRAAGHGAYFLLCMHYWATGGLPDDDKQLATIGCMTDREWKAHKPMIKALFKGDGDWKHKRIEEELVVAQAKYEKRSAAGKLGGEAKANVKQKPSNATAKPYQPITDNQTDSGTSAGAREPLISPEAFELSSDFLKAIGFPEGLELPPEWVGTPYRAQVWITSGWPREVVLSTAAKVMEGRKAPPHIKYFEKAFANAVASLSADVPTGKASELSHEKSARRSPITAAIDDHIERLRSAERDGGGGAGEAVAGLLPDRRRE